LFPLIARVSGVVEFFSMFRGSKRRWSVSPAKFAINLQSLGGAIGRIQAEPMRLPGGSQRAPTRPAVAAEPRALTAAEPLVREVKKPDLTRSASPFAKVKAKEATPGAKPREAPPSPAAARGTTRPAPTGGPSGRGKPSTPRPQTQDFLAVHGVEKSFVGRKVVRGVSLYVRGGEAVGLLGPNGAGKTTVFYMITGLIQADRGRIELDGYDVTKLPMYQRARLGIGYLPQEASIFRGLNVEDNIRSVLEIVEPNRRKREAELDALLEEFNIGRLRKSPSIALSGGERRRVEIARALATRPRYMLLDEPFAGIDPIAVGDIQALVRHLTQRGIGVLITDHNVRETLGLTDRGYIIYSGEVLMEGRADDIVNHPEVRRLYLGEEFRM
jgi:lipopolysaccharide export system ATP-binding protein